MLHREANNKDQYGIMVKPSELQNYFRGECAFLACDYNCIMPSNKWAPWTE